MITHKWINSWQLDCLLLGSQHFTTLSNSFIKSAPWNKILWVLNVTKLYRVSMLRFRFCMDSLDIHCSICMEVWRWLHYMQPLIKSFSWQRNRFQMESYQYTIGLRLGGGGHGSSKIAAPFSLFYHNIFGGLARVLKKKGIFLLMLYHHTILTRTYLLFGFKFCSFDMACTPFSGALYYTWSRATDLVVNIIYVSMISHWKSLETAIKPWEQTHLPTLAADRPSEPANIFSKIKCTSKRESLLSAVQTLRPEAPSLTDWPTGCQLQHKASLSWQM